MLNTWKDQYDIPIFNYYEGFKDLRWLLKGTPKKELDSSNYEYLGDMLMEMQDWFSSEIDESSHKTTYKKISKLIRYKYMRATLQRLILGLQAFGIDTRTEWLLNSVTLTALKVNLQSLQMPYRDRLNDQIKDINKRIKGLNNDIGILEKDLSKNQSLGEYNYMESVIQANKILGFRINPREYTLYEWVNTLKVIKKTPKN
jgi:hypothetical protein